MYVSIYIYIYIYVQIIYVQIDIFIFISFIHATLKRPIFMGERGALAPKLITTAVAAVSRHKRAYTSTAPKTPKHTTSPQGTYTAVTLRTEAC